MSQSIGELFVNLGVKGDAKTISALARVKTGLGDAASMSIEAKAGVLGLFYALERLTAASGQLGTHLTNFTTLTGFTSKMVQEYDYAGRQVGLTNSQVEGSLKSLQSVMANVQLNQDIPKWLFLVNKALSESGEGAIERSRIGDTAHVFQKFQEFAGLKIDPAIKRKFIEGTGISEDVFAGMERNAFRPDVFGKAPLLADAEISRLAKINAAWSNLGTKIEMIIARLNAKHGFQLVKDIDAIAVAIGHLIEQTDKFATKLEIFDRTGHALEGAANSLKLVSEILDKISGKESKKGDLLYQPPGQELIPGFSKSPLSTYIKEEWQGIKSGFDRMKEDFKHPLWNPGTAVPKIGTPSTNTSHHSQSNKVSQSFHFNGDGKNANEVSEAAHKGIENYFRSNPAAAQGN